MTKSDATGYATVTSDVRCVITRFQVKSVIALLRSYIAFRRVRSASARVPGLLKAVFVVENRRTFYSVSIWRDAAAVLEFNTFVSAHAEAATFAVPRTYDRTRGRYELWSAEFHLTALSTNTNWDTFDIKAHVDASVAVGVPNRCHS